MIKHIKRHTEQFHKLLIIGVASLSLFGLSGCNKSIKHVNLADSLTHANVYSSSLSRVIGSQFKPNITNHLSGPNNVSIDLSNHLVGFSRGTDNDAKSFATNEHYSIQQSNNHKSKYEPIAGGSRQVIHYHFNNPKRTLTLSSGHYHNQTQWITYRLIKKYSYLNSNIEPDGLYYVFKPIALKHFNHKPVKISAYIAKYNHITLVTANRKYSDLVTGRLRTHIKPKNHFRRPTLNDAD